MVAKIPEERSLIRIVERCKETVATSVAGVRPEPNEVCVN